MEFSIIASAVLLCVYLYNQVIVQRQYAAVLFKFHVFCIVMAPGVAVMKWNFNTPREVRPGIAAQLSPKFTVGEDPAYEVCISIMVLSIFTAIFCTGRINYGDSLKTVLYHGVTSLVMSLAMVAYSMWKMGVILNQAHVSFVCWHVPGIVGRYLMRLPLDIWADIYWVATVMGAHFLGSIVGHYSKASTNSTHAEL